MGRVGLECLAPICGKYGTTAATAAGLRPRRMGDALAPAEVVMLVGGRRPSASL